MCQRSASARRVSCSTAPPRHLLKLAICARDMLRERPSSRNRLQPRRAKQQTRTNSGFWRWRIEAMWYKSVFECPTRASLDLLLFRQPLLLLCRVLAVARPTRPLRASSRRPRGQRKLRVRAHRGRSVRPLNLVMLRSRALQRQRSRLHHLSRPSGARSHLQSRLARPPEVHRAG